MGRQRAEYIAEMTAGLAKMARDEGLHMLAYILDVAKLEAEECSGRAIECAGAAPADEAAWH
jgi:hypothetical protein